MSDARPVGIFDSGVGGLSVLREVARLLPEEEVVFLADEAWCPYGERPLEQIRHRSLQIGRWLVERGAKAILVACNTASAAALQTLRAELSVPIVGIEPAVKPAAALTRSGRIGVLATTHTARSERLSWLVQSYASGAQVLIQDCPDLVPLIEQGHLAGPRLLSVLERYLHPLLERQVDVLVLGCTHYPLVEASIKQVCGPAVEVINPAPAVARQLTRVLEQLQLRSPAQRQPHVHWYTTGSPEHFTRLLHSLGYAIGPSRVQACEPDPAQAPLRQRLG